MPANTNDMMKPVRCLSQVWPAPTWLNGTLALKQAPKNV